MSNFSYRNEFALIWKHVIDYLPNLIGAILILLIGGLIAAFIGSIVKKALRRVRFDRAIHSSPGGTMVSRVIESPANFTGRVVYWLIMIGVISLAIGALNLPILNNLLYGIYGYVPNVIAAVVIFLVASAVSSAVVKFVQRVMGRTPFAKLLAASVPAIVMSLAVFMILNQLGVAKDIVNILFTAIVGSAALGLALAFGLGGRDVARELLEQASENARTQAPSVRAEVRSAASRTKGSSAA